MMKRVHRRADDPARWKNCANCHRRFEKDPRNTWAYWAKAKHCSQDCAGEAWAKFSAERRAPEQEAFSRWIDKSGDCWLWTGARDRDGYGAFSYAGKTRRAPIVALELDGRKPAKGQYACHRCDNPACVRPEHLYPGTPTQNMADAIARDRTVRGARQHMARLTDNDVLHIRASSDPAVDLAARFGVSRSNIDMIRNRKTWKHLP